MININKCKKCGKKLTKERVVKFYDECYRVWCVCGHESFYYKDPEAELKRMQERIEKEKEVKNE